MACFQLFFAGAYIGRFPGCPGTSKKCDMGRLYGEFFDPGPALAVHAWSPPDSPRTVTSLGTGVKVVLGHSVLNWVQQSL